MPLKVVSLVLGTFFALFVGIPGVGLGVGFSLWSIGVLITLLLLLRSERSIWRGFPDWFDFSASVVVAILPTFYSNELVLSIAVTALFLQMYVSTLRLTLKIPRISLLMAFWNFVSHISLVYLRFVYVIKRTLDPSTYKISKSLAAGMLLSLVPLFIFHALFSSVNREYAEAIDWILAIILDPIMLLRIFEAWLWSTLTYAFFTARITEAAVTEEAPTVTTILTLALLPIAVLFGIFSLFQLDAVFVAMRLESFKELSLYVQKGFWELLTAAAIGYLCWYAVYCRGENVSSRITKSRVIGFFCLLLILISAFTAHKLALLQASFGFKDQRFFASLASILLAWVFTLSFLHICRFISGTVVFHSGLSALIVSTALLGVCNVDLLAARDNPIRFYIDEQPRRDLSYLLGNSFDNVQEWETLMTEGIEQGLPMPRDYYWGRYFPLCYNSRSASPRDRVYLVSRHDRLAKKYSRAIDSLRQIGMYNLAEYEAYRWILSNSGLVNKFYEAAARSC